MRRTICHRVCADRYGSQVLIWLYTHDDRAVSFVLYNYKGQDCTKSLYDTYIFDLFLYFYVSSYDGKGHVPNLASCRYGADPRRNAFRHSILFFVLRVSSLSDGIEKYYERMVFAHIR